MCLKEDCASLDCSAEALTLGLTSCGAGSEVDSVIECPLSSLEAEVCHELFCCRMSFACCVLFCDCWVGYCACGCCSLGGGIEG